MSREVLDACLTISLERNYNLSQHIKEVKASQCHPLLMYKKTENREKKVFIITYLKDPSLNSCLLWDSHVVSTA